MESINVEDIQHEGVRKRTGKCYCANCAYCILVKLHTSKYEYLLRVKCEKNKWRKKLGDEKMYKYFSVNRRVVPDCDSYEEMGDLKSYIKDLKNTLPQSDEIYSTK